RSRFVPCVVTPHLMTTPQAIKEAPELANSATPVPTQIVLAGMVGDSYGVDDSRAPIVLLHGQTFSRKHWTPVIAELHRIDPNRRVIALDLPGHGESPAQLPHTTVHILSLLREAVDQAGFAAPVMVGHSSSGGAVVMYAAVHPTSGAVDVEAVPT